MKMKTKRFFYMFLAVLFVLNLIACGSTGSTQHTINAQQSGEQRMEESTDSKREEYKHAEELYHAGEYEKALAAFRVLNGYRDSNQYIVKCEYIIQEEIAAKEAKYNKAIELMNAGQYSEAIATFETLMDYKDSAERIPECEAAMEAEKQAEIEAKYNEAEAFFTDGNYKEAYDAFRVMDYKDSAEKAEKSFFKMQIKEINSKEVTVKSYICFGSYEQDNDPTNGKEEIEWQVLAVEGNKVLLVSRYVLDCMPFSTSEPVSWENCNLRSWLNDEFYREAFGPKHQKMILKTTVKAEGNPTYDTSPGEDTTDKIFLLSISEVKEYITPLRRGQLQDVEKRCAPTEYAKAQGAEPSPVDRIDGKYTCFWWLRNPGEDSGYAVFVSSYGGIIEMGNAFFSRRVGVRPAMWIQIGS